MLNPYAIMGVTQSKDKYFGSKGVSKEFAC